MNEAQIIEWIGRQRLTSIYLHADGRVTINIAKRASGTNGTQWKDGHKFSAKTLSEAVHLAQQSLPR